MSDTMTIADTSGDLVEDGDGGGLEGLVHIICCDDDTALCGTDVAGDWGEVTESDSRCAVCDDIFEVWDQTEDEHAPTCPEAP